MHKADICIVASAYNNQSIIKEFLTSLTDQEFKDWKLYIADDKSDDNTIDIIKEFALKEKRINLIPNHENLGLTNTLNKLIMSLPEDSYIVRMDTDEIHSRFYLKKIFETLNQENYDLILFTRKKFYVSLLNLLSPYLSSLFISLWGNIFCHGTSVFSKRLFNKCGGYRRFIYYSQDHCLWVNMLFYAKKRYIFSLKEFRIRQLENNKRISVQNFMEQSIFSLFAINEFVQLTLKKKNTMLYLFSFWFLILVSIIFKFFRKLFLI